MKRQFTFIGELPPGDWRFLLVTIKGQADVIVVWEKDGQFTPRMIVDGKLVELKPSC